MFSPSLAMAAATSGYTGPFGAWSHATSAASPFALISVMMSLSNCWKSSVRATKSDSQFTSTRTPPELSAVTAWPISPSDVARPAFFAALASPFLRRIVLASSTLPLASSRAALQSIMPAPVWSRSFFTSAALIAMVSLVRKKTPAPAYERPASIGDSRNARLRGGRGRLTATGRTCRAFAACVIRAVAGGVGFD